MSEHQEQVTFFEWVRLNRKHAPNQEVRDALELCYSVPNGFYSKSNKVQNDMKAEGLTKGILDVNLDWPFIVESDRDISPPDGIYWYNVEKLIFIHLYAGLRLEFKYRHTCTVGTQKKMKTGDYLVDLSKEQKRKRELLLRAGYQVKVVYSAVQAIKTVFDYLPFKTEDYQGIKEYLS